MNAALTDPPLLRPDRTGDFFNLAQPRQSFLYSAR